VYDEAAVLCGANNYVVKLVREIGETAEKKYSTTFVLEKLCRL
jgi:hypothetical protein